MNKLFGVSFICAAIFFNVSNSNADIIHTFNNLDEQVMGGSRGGEQNYIITNNTAETWTDFHVRVDVGSITSYEGPGEASNADQWNIDIVNLDVSSGSNLLFSLATAQKTIKKKTSY